MKLHRQLLEDITLNYDILSLGDLKTQDHKYYSGVVNINGEVLLTSQDLTELPVQFGKVDSIFNCSNNRLTSLKGAPREVGGNFSCYDNSLTSLEGAPREVGGNFYCYHNKLTSLEGAPRKVKGVFNCFDNYLTSLKGAPEEVGSIFNCEYNKITSLEGIHKIIKRIDGPIFLHHNPIESGGIGLLLIEGLTGIKAELLAFNIIEKYIGQGKKGLLHCQEELIERGLEEYAKL